MKRKLSLLLAAVLVCLSASGCSAAGRLNGASRIVNEDLEGITALAERILQEEKVPEDASLAGVEKIEYRAPGWVGFTTGSRGEGNSAAVCGFYYSRDDQPLGYQGEEMELSASGAGWAWQGGAESGGDGENRYYTERFQFYWYYYEMYL